MKRNLLNFTRGSQLLGHFGFMFAAGLKGPLIVAAIVIAWTSWWTLWGQLRDLLFGDDLGLEQRQSAAA